MFSQYALFSWQNNSILVRGLIKCKLFRYSSFNTAILSHQNWVDHPESRAGEFSLEEWIIGTSWLNLGLFNNVFSTTYTCHRMSNCIMPGNVRSQLTCCATGLWKTTKNLKTAGISVEIRYRNLSNTKQECVIRSRGSARPSCSLLLPQR